MSDREHPDTGVARSRDMSVRFLIKGHRDIGNGGMKECGPSYMVHTGLFGLCGPTRLPYVPMPSCPRQNAPICAGILKIASSTSGRISTLSMVKTTSCPMIF